VPQKAGLRTGFFGFIVAIIFSQKYYNEAV